MDFAFIILNMNELQNLSPPVKLNEWKINEHCEHNQEQIPPGPNGWMVCCRLVHFSLGHFSCI
jgi:hypothetical protein